MVTGSYNIKNIKTENGNRLIVVWGTGSGLGTRVLSLLEEEFPDVCRIVTSMYPSAEDDVITSPYNSVLAMRELTEHADCVLPVENQVSALMSASVFLYPCRRLCSMYRWSVLSTFSHSSLWWTSWTRSTPCLTEQSQGPWSGERAPSRSEVDWVEQRSPLMPWITSWLTCCSTLPGMFWCFSQIQKTPVS